MSWKKELRHLLPALGHRNWVVIADAAFPQQCSAGVRVIVADEPLLNVLADAVEILKEAKHVRPVAVLDAELEHLTDTTCPGVNALRATLKLALAAVETESVLHEELLVTLAEAAKTYTMLVIKTTCRIPYTSVFFRLECGYWGPEQERTLRETMAAYN